MLNLPISIWSWGPLGLALLASAIASGYAIAKPASAASPRIVYRRFFEGPGLTNSGAVSTVLSMLPLLLSVEVREDVVSASLLGSATLLFAITTFLGVWLYSTVAAQAAHKGETVALTSNRLIVVQSIITSCMIVAVGCFLTFILVTPVLGPRHDATPAPKAVYLKCSATGCIIDIKHKG